MNAASSKLDRVRPIAGLDQRINASTLQFSKANAPLIQPPKKIATLL
jgi:hypothetical protein